MAKITVFTPTYNRGWIIEALYRSLQRQTKNDFEWLVIDDGSTDNTEELFAKWVKENNSFSIRYYKQENKGLIRTFNRGIELAEGEYLSKIDSDDYVIDEYIENILSWINTLTTINRKNKIYAVAGIKGRDSSVPLKGSFPHIPKEGFLDATDLERKIYNLDGDMSEAWSVDVLRKYKLPVWDSEKFAPEQIAFYQIALDGYKIRWFNKIIQICEYQEDGLTKNSWNLVKENPMGYAMMYNQHIFLRKTFSGKLFAALQFNTLCILGRKPIYILKSNSPMCSVIMLIPSMFLTIRRKFQYRK